MSVKVNVHYFLPHLTRDQDCIEVNGNTVDECLEQFVSEYPKARQWLYREDGNLSNFVDVHVNMDVSCQEELAVPVKDGDEIFLVMMISGG